MGQGLVGVNHHSKKWALSEGIAFPSVRGIILYKGTGSPYLFIVVYLYFKQSATFASLIRVGLQIRVWDTP